MKSYCFEIDNIDKIFQLFNFFTRQGETWIFRGQANSTIAFAPSVLNERLYAQQGLFVIPCSLKKSLTELLEHVLKTDFSPNTDPESDWEIQKIDSENAVLIKFDFKGNIVRDILVALRKMNISADHLFPDITGMCRSLSLLASGYRLNKDKFYIRGEL